jgi:hypothetical protein
MVVKVEGHPNSKLEFYPISACGGIKDGVGFAHAGEGGWVISFVNLKKMYQAAVKVRQTKEK